VTTNAELDAQVIELDRMRAPAFTDEALALRFAEQHRHELRYIAAWSRWMIWDERQWRFDDTLHAFNLARQICREVATECNKKRTASILASAKTVAAVERLSKADRRIAATVAQWDPDPWLLNTPAGIVDLRTGDVQSHDPTLYMTKITAVAPGEDCPIWHTFLERITAGDTSLIDFLQRVVGYSLTGVTREHAMFFGYGTGANGKSVFVNTISGILGEYHRTAPIETFTASSGERHPTDLAGLRGARLVTAIETEEGRRWAESKIKALTGGDQISARFMRQDFFEYVPQFKLLIAGNHKPGLRSIDEAIRRRFHLIPFTVTIPPDERDDTLTERLREEWPGILAWMIDGCAKWLEQGLRPPEAVTAATAAYLEAQDAISAWMDECIERVPRDPTAWVSAKELFESWSAWATAAGEYIGTRPRLIDKLESKGLEARRRNHGRGFAGLALKRPYETTTHYRG
jgi:putative DNA primase/helicase